jgi:hypothetical protein
MTASFYMELVSGISGPNTKTVLEASTHGTLCTDNTDIAM